LYERLGKSCENHVSQTGEKEKNLLNIFKDGFMTRALNRTVSPVFNYVVWNHCRNLGCEMVEYLRTTFIPFYVKLGGRP